MSKGSKPRPFSVAQEQYDQRWDLIFGRDKNQKERDWSFDKERDRRDEALQKMADNARAIGLNYEEDGQLERDKVFQAMQDDLDRMIERAENENR